MKNLSLSVIFSFGILFTHSLVTHGAVINFSKAASLATTLAQTPTNMGGLGCNYSAISTVDEGYRSDNTEIIRTVLYADCIPCLHVYMFEKKTGKLVFSKSIVLLDPVSFKQTCELDRNQALRN